MKRQKFTQDQLKADPQLILREGSISRRDILRSKSKYTKNRHYYCDEVVKQMAQGKTRVATAVALGITISIMKGWERKHKEFRESVQLGKEIQEAWWDEMGRKNLTNNHFNTPLYIRMRSILHGWRIAEGALTAPIKPDSTPDNSYIDNLHNLTIEELNALREIAEKLKLTDKHTGAECLPENEATYKH